jgi:hypothetical protein
MEIKKPNLFIIGAPKSGTTFLYDKLKNHPQLFFPKIKELNYFSYEFLNKYSYYKDFKIKSEKKYLSFFKKGSDKKYLVDASVSYFTFDDVPKKIKKFNPESKFIIIVRDPYKRAYSHYLMDKRMGYAYNSFTYYLNDPTSFHYRQYISNSQYEKQYRKYRNIFGSNNILIIQLENIQQDFKKIFSFLKIESIDVDFSKRVNENKISKNFIGNITLRNRNFIEKIKLLIPENILKYLKRIIYTKAKTTSISENQLIKIKKMIKKDYEIFKETINEKG